LRVPAAIDDDELAVEHDICAQPRECCNHFGESFGERAPLARHELDVTADLAGERAEAVKLWLEHPIGVRERRPREARMHQVVVRDEPAGALLGRGAHCHLVQLPAQTATPATTTRRRSAAAGWATAMTPPTLPTAAISTLRIGRIEVTRVRVNVANLRLADDLVMIRSTTLAARTA